jgi:acyl-CoA thioesterase
MGFNERLGMRIGADGASIELEPQAAHEAVPGAVHFAVLATLAEVAAAQAAAAPVVPTHVSVQLLRRASSAERLNARGRVLKAGRALIFAEGEVTQAGELVAKATVTFARI